jgi:hypothetical protein
VLLRGSSLGRKKRATNPAAPARGNGNGRMREAMGRGRPRGRTFEASSNGPASLARSLCCLRRPHAYFAQKGRETCGRNDCTTTSAT